MFHWLKHNWLPLFGEVASVRLFRFCPFNTAILDPEDFGNNSRGIPATCASSPLLSNLPSRNHWKHLERSAQEPFLFCLPSKSSVRPSRSLTLNLHCPCVTPGARVLLKHTANVVCVIPLQLLASAHWLRSLSGPLRWLQRRAPFLAKPVFTHQDGQDRHFVSSPLLSSLST